MGTDIHFYVEKRVNGIWVTADTWYKDKEDGTLSTYDRDSSHYNRGGPYYTGRSYSLFSILADVRNGYGFAGCDTGDGYKPIAEPRGLPEDVCKEVKDAFDEYGDGHSTSNLLLAEILNYDWTQTTKLRGVVNPAGFAEWCVRGMPSNFWGLVSGSNIKNVSNDVMSCVIKHKLGCTTIDYSTMCKLKNADKPLDDNSKYFTQVEWTVPYYETAYDFWAKTIPQLLALGKPEDVRIVFWFDN